MLQIHYNIFVQLFQNIWLSMALVKQTKNRLLSDNVYKTYVLRNLIIRSNYQLHEHFNTFITS